MHARHVQARVAPKRSSCVQVASQTFKLRVTASVPSIGIVYIVPEYHRLTNLSLLRAGCCEY
eukprot:2591207-Rhodomonas_salina.2